MSRSANNNLRSIVIVLIGRLSLDAAAAFAPARRIVSSSRIPAHRYLHALHHSHGEDDDETSPNNNNNILDGDVASQLHRDISTAVASAAILASVLASPVNIRVDHHAVDYHHHTCSNSDHNAPLAGAATAVAPTVRVGRSDARAAAASAASLTENQRVVADAWFAVSAQYFDRTYNGLGEEGWRAAEGEAMTAVADTGPDDDEIVEGAIKTMLGALDDPYTRFLSREKYEALTAYATGGNSGGGAAGIGVQLLEDPRTKNVVVMATTSGGPAAAAGVRAGDAILRVDGESMEGASADVVAAKCRGEAGGKVEVDFLRTAIDDNGSGANRAAKQSTERMTLTRAKIKPNPIEASTYVSTGGKKVGLLRVPSFSTETVGQMVDGLRTISGDDDDGRVDAIAIDIRGNVGGYMPAGVDAAKLFLPARAHIIAEVGRSGYFKAYDADGIGAETSMPLYLLVDKRTASASEIFAAALQDNKRAVVVGTTNTFGKGRIQNVQPLENGTGVAVTRARYVTPKGRDVHGVGIKPDRVLGRCEASDSARACLADVVDG